MLLQGGSGMVPILSGVSSKALVDSKGGELNEMQSNASQEGDIMRYIGQVRDG